MRKIAIAIIPLTLLLKYIVWGIIFRHSFLYKIFFLIFIILVMVVDKSIIFWQSIFIIKSHLLFFMLDTTKHQTINFCEISRTNSFLLASIWTLQLSGIRSRRHPSLGCKWPFLINLNALLDILFGILENHPEYFSTAHGVSKTSSQVVL